MWAVSASSSSSCSKVAICTVTGKTLAENYAHVEFPTDQDVVRPITNPLSETGGVVGLKGNLAPQGAIVKIAGLHSIQFRGPARVSVGERLGFP